MECSLSFIASLTFSYPVRFFSCFPAGCMVPLSCSRIVQVYPSFSCLSHFGSELCGCGQYACVLCVVPFQQLAYKQGNNWYLFSERKISFEQLNLTARSTTRIVQMKSLTTSVLKNELSLRLVRIFFFFLMSFPFLLPLMANFIQFFKNSRGLLLVQLKIFSYFLFLHQLPAVRNGQLRVVS